MLCNIKWNTLNFSEWQAKFNQIPASNLLQSYFYAKALCPIYNQKARWGLIFIDGQEAGLVQILEAGILKNIFHAVICDRGPLWFKNYGSREHYEAFLIEFTRQFPKRWGRKRRIIPEIENSYEIHGILVKNGFQKPKNDPYETIFIDLRKDLDGLRANFKKKWRNALSKSEKMGLKLEWTDEGENLAFLLEKYLIDKTQKQYDGPSIQILEALGKTFAPEKSCLIGTAKLNNKAIASILILTHGSSATYQIGWTSPQGRDSCAHYLLLWDALNMLQQRGITDFDLGGINDGSAKGVKKFKEGMGGQLVRLPGLYTG